MKLPLNFYTRNNVLTITRELLGKYVFTRINGEITGGYITEAEAYNGITDKASHAFGGKRTPRTQTMYAQGGIAYIYICYGIHQMLNVVTSAEGEPHAVLIRAIKPTDGIETMLQRRGMNGIKPNLSAGPGTLAKALAVDKYMYGVSLMSNTLWIEDRGLSFADEQIIAAPRIGVEYAAEDALLPYRLYVV